MDYKRFDDTILVRMDRGEEILEQVKAVALKEQVTLASVQALGATISGVAKCSACTSTSPATAVTR